MSNPDVSQGSERSVSASEAQSTGSGGVAAEPSEAALHAAMDAFYPGEDWRTALGGALDTSLRDMRAALKAAQAVDGGGAAASLSVSQWLAAQESAARERTMHTDTANASWHLAQAKAYEAAHAYAVARPTPPAGAGKTEQLSDAGSGYPTRNDATRAGRAFFAEGNGTLGVEGSDFHVTQIDGRWHFEAGRDPVSN